MKKLNIDSIKKLNIKISIGLSESIVYLFRKNLDFDIKLSDGTSLQRELCWTIEQKQDLILSIVRKQSIPPITVLVKDDYTTYQVIDGKQRLNAIKDFIDNKFPIEIEDESYFLSDFDEISKCAFLNRWLSFNSIYERISKDDKIIPYSDKELIEIFEYINFRGTPQDAEHLKLLKSKIGK